MNRFNKIALFAMLGSVTLLGGASARAAETAATVRDVTVSYGDLDISTQAGAEALLSRLKVAARRSCGGHPDSRGMAEAKAFDACVANAMDAAVTRVGAPKLSALFGKPTEEVATSK